MVRLSDRDVFFERGAVPGVAFKKYKQTTSSLVCRTSSDFSNQAYTFDVVGNIMSITDTKAALVQC